MTNLNIDIDKAENAIKNSKILLVAFSFVKLCCLNALMTERPNGVMDWTAGQEKASIESVVTAN